MHIVTTESLPLLFAVSLIFLVAGVVKGVVGLGLPTVAIGLLGLVMAPREAASLLIVPSLVTNVWQLAAGNSFKSLAMRLWPMLLGICIATLAGGMLLPHDITAYATVFLGVALMLYAALGLAAVRMALPDCAKKAWLSISIGVMTGLVTSATGVFVIPAVPYLQGLDLSKEELVQALGLVFTVSTVSLAASLVLDGAFNPAVTAASIYALVPTLGGMLFGQWIRMRIRLNVFRRIFFLGLLGLGVHLSLRSLMS